MSSSQQSISELLKQFDDNKHLRGSKALELIMRDVMDGLEEFATLAGFSPTVGNCYEILSDDVAAPRPPSPLRKKLHNAQIVSLDRNKIEPIT